MGAKQVANDWSSGRRLQSEVPVRRISNQSRMRLFREVSQPEIDPPGSQISKMASMPIISRVSIKIPINVLPDCAHLATVVDYQSSIARNRRNDRSRIIAAGRTVIKLEIGLRFL